MMTLKEFLKTSYTSYHAAENCAEMLTEAGFCELFETDRRPAEEGGKYFVRRGGAIIAFRVQGGPMKIVASHTDSPALKLKDNAVVAGDILRLNTEPYGGGLWYTYFDRPLRIAGRIVTEQEGRLISELYTSPYRVILPSLAIHLNREANEKFAPNLQTELPLLGMGEVSLPEAVSYDLFAVPDEEPFESGVNGEFISAPRIDDLTSVYCSVQALIETEGEGTSVAACLDSEEVGSRTYGGAASGFLRSVLERIAGEELARLLPASFLVSLDNAHALHPNHPEKYDLTNRAPLGSGVVIKGHAGGAYTTDGLTSAVIKTVLKRADVKFTTFYNRSDMRSGSTLGALSLGEVSVPSADLGLPQLAMHSAVETVAKSDLAELQKALAAFYAANIVLDGDSAAVE